jgi:hypothetical protein
VYIVGYTIVDCKVSQIINKPQICTINGVKRVHMTYVDTW